MWELLIQSFRKRNIEFTPDELTLLQSTFRYKEYRKHQYILQQGDVCRYKSFIIRGLTRTYDVDEKGQEHVLLFGAEDWWVVDLYSFLSGKPTSYNIDCLENTEVLQISRQSLDVLYAKIPKLNEYFRLLLQNAFISLSQRMVASLSRPAIERYDEFVAAFPHIEQRISNNQIASFLGVTPQSLSRLRKQSMERSRSKPKAL